MDSAPLTPRGPVSSCGRVASCLSFRRWLTSLSASLPSAHRKPFLPQQSPPVHTSAVGPFDHRRQAAHLRILVRRVRPNHRTVVHLADGPCWLPGRARQPRLGQAHPLRPCREALKLVPPAVLGARPPLLALRHLPDGPAHVALLIAPNIAP
eukprot:scaffold15407_cov62-Phaeocystis_antarctica.AAC.3